MGGWRSNYLRALDNSAPRQSITDEKPSLMQAVSLPAGGAVLTGHCRSRSARRVPLREECSSPDSTRRPTVRSSGWGSSRAGVWEDGSGE